MTFRTTLAALAFAPLMALPAAAATIDFTDGTWTAGMAPSQVVDGVTVTLTGFRHVNATGQVRQREVNFSASEGHDGVGISDDEISKFADAYESLVLTFSEAVNVTGLGFLDLFVTYGKTPQEGPREIARVEFDNGIVRHFGAVQNFGMGLPGALEVSFKPITTTQLTFTLPGLGNGDLSNNDGVGVPDYSLASVTCDPISPVPLPAAGWMLLAGVAGLAGLKRARRDRA